MIKERKKLSLLSSVLLILLSISIAVGGQLLLKIGIDKIGISGFSSMKSLVSLFSGIIKSPLVLTGLFLYLISAAIWLIVLSTVDLSFAYPFIGLTYVLVLILAIEMEVAALAPQLALQLILLLLESLDLLFVVDVDPE